MVEFRGKNHERNDTMFKKELLDLTYNFSLSILNLTSRFHTQNEYIISNQLGRSGTSIGANIREAQYAQSTADFLSKIKIALKEAAETKYWIDLSFDTKLLTGEEYESLTENIDCILRMLVHTAKVINEKCS